MADVTGPISTLPGSNHPVPKGAKCDDHPDRLATHRVQGETDSMGSEMADVCDECFSKFKVYTPEDSPCDWCKKESTDLRPTRDYEEGMSGPVYYVCSPCRKRQNDEARAYLEDDDWY
jgi:hypothetical protein